MTTSGRGIKPQDDVKPADVRGSVRRGDEGEHERCLVQPKRGEGSWVGVEGGSPPPADDTDAGLGARNKMNRNVVFQERT